MAGEQHPSQRCRNITRFFLTCCKWQQSHPQVAACPVSNARAEQNTNLQLQPGRTGQLPNCPTHQLGVFIYIRRFSFSQPRLPGMAGACEQLLRWFQAGRASPWSRRGAGHAPVPRCGAHCQPAAASFLPRGDAWGPPHQCCLCDLRS